ncbi:MAG: TolC family protein [Gemmatimonadales bacterium]
MTTLLHAQEPVRRLTMDEVVDVFARHSPALEAARADGAALVASTRAAGVFPNPALGVSRESVADADRRGGETYLTISQPLRWPWVGRSRAAVIREAQAAVAAQFSADSLDLVFTLQQAFVEAWLAEQRREVLQRVAGVVEQLAQQGRERFAAGDLSGLDLRRLALERIRYDRLATTAALDVDATRRTLAASVLPPSDRSLVAPAGLPVSPEIAGVHISDISEILRHHPRLVAYRAGLALAEAEARAESMLRLPAPALTAGYKHQDDGLQGLLLGAVIPVALFDRRAGPRQVAAARVNAATTRLAMAERQAGDELRSASARHAAAANQAARLAESAPAGGDDLLDIALVAYTGGELDLLGLLATVEAWRELGALAAAVRAEYWISRYALERALGGAHTMIQPAGQEAR